MCVDRNAISAAKNGWGPIRIIRLPVHRLFLLLRITSFDKDDQMLTGDHITTMIIMSRKNTFYVKRF